MGKIKGDFYRNTVTAVVNHDTSDNTIEYIRSFLSDDTQLSICHAPYSSIAMAALKVLGVENYADDGTDSLENDSFLYFLKYFRLIYDGVETVDLS